MLQMPSSARFAITTEEATPAGGRVHSGSGGSETLCSSEIAWLSAHALVTVGDCCRCRDHHSDWLADECYGCDSTNSPDRARRSHSMRDQGRQRPTHTTARKYSSADRNSGPRVCEPAEGCTVERRQR